MNKLKEDAKSWFTPNESAQVVSKVSFLACYVKSSLLTLVEGLRRVRGDADVCTGTENNG